PADAVVDDSARLSAGGAGQESRRLGAVDSDHVRDRHSAGGVQLALRDAGAQRVAAVQPSAAGQAGVPAGDRRRVRAGDRGERPEVRPRRLPRPAAGGWGHVGGTGGGSAMRAMAAPIAIALAAAGLGAGLAGCRGDRTDKPPRQFLPDMDDSPKWEPQGGSPFFLDAEDVSAEAGSVPGAEVGRMMRPKPEGAVAFGALPVAAAEGQFDPAFRDRLVSERDGYLRGDDAFYYGVD